METKFTNLGKRDFSDYKYRVYTNLPGLLEPDLTGVNIYQAVCAKECPFISPDNAKIVDGKAVIQFDIMATTNFTDGIDTGNSKYNLEITDSKNMLNLVIFNSTSR